MAEVIQGACRGQVRVPALSCLLRESRQDVVTNRAITDGSLLSLDMALSQTHMIIRANSCTVLSVCCSLF